MPGVVGLLALVGHAHETSRLLPLAHGEHRIQLARDTWQPPPAIEQSAAALLTYAVFGVYPDSVRILARRTCDLIANYVPDTVRAREIQSVLVAGAFGYGSVGEAKVSGVTFDSPDEVVKVVLMLSLGDTSGARQQLKRLAAIDKGKLPGNGFRMAFKSARAWLALGDTSRARRQLDEMLHTLPLLDPGFLSEVPQVVALVRAFALRAQLAQSAGEREVALSDASVVKALWSGGDADVQAFVAANAMKSPASHNP